MSEPSFQTMRLARGKHAAPDHGACVMELASMLAGERFSDHPRSVSPVIAAFLRGYNDLLDDSRRQDLRRYATEAVGTAAAEAVEEARARRLIEWADERWGQGPRLGLGGAPAPWPPQVPPTDPDSAGIYAIRSVHSADRRLHAQVLALLDELIAMGQPATALAARRSAPLTPLDRRPLGADHGSHVGCGTDPSPEHLPALAHRSHKHHRTGDRGIAVRPLPS